MNYEERLLNQLDDLIALIASINKELRKHHLELEDVLNKREAYEMEQGIEFEEDLESEN